VVEVKRLILNLIARSLCLRRRCTKKLMLKYSRDYLIYYKNIFTIDFITFIIDYKD
jgi:hypothetical protein